MGIVKPSRIILSSEDERAQLMLDTLTCKKGKRYESGLLWRYDNVRLPDSKTKALKRWQCLERRMQTDESLRNTLDQKITDYLAKGYIRKLSNAELQFDRTRVWYLPVFPVVNPNKPDKTRLVWDAAAKAYGVSLNSVLLKGPDYLTSLLSILIQFREHPVAICGDLREMYHQVLIRKEDQHCQRFLWGRDPDTYIMQVMTFGACCSPSTAQYVKNKHAASYENEFPAAVRAIIKQHYVDDMLVSVETEKEALSLARDVNMIHTEGGFEMRNWRSNSSVVQAKLSELRETEKNLYVTGGLTTEKILGMWWNTAQDCFTFKLSSRHADELLAGRRRPTKREVLRTLMLTFDPMGLIANFLMYLKVLLQDIWRSGIGWDDPIKEPEFQKWLVWVRVLHQIEKLEVRRCYRTASSKHADVQLHTFVDASENGFAAATYLRFEEGSSIECVLVSAKTRVAPIKFLSIPRSELQAAVLGMRLTKTILESLTIDVKEALYYTDSRDVCCWLNSDHRRYSQFVAFRVSEILEHTETTDWYWIPTKYNVADEGTKWNGVPKLDSSSRWFRGPDFLWEPANKWPVLTQQCGETDVDLRPHLLMHMTMVQPLVSPEKFSRWSTLLRRIESIHRLAFNWRRLAKKEIPTKGPITRDERIRAQNYLYRIAQEDTFTDEIAILKASIESGASKPFPKSSPIYRVNPNLDHQNIIRVQGRTGACKYIDITATNPVILPREHTITKLIVAHFHLKFHHQNHETVVNELRQQYYIPRLKVVYQKVRKQCQQCKNDSAVPRPPLMATLPEARLAAYTSPFTHMGVDYFGPIKVSLGRRTEKKWGVLATCLTTRAIHLQIAHSLSTDSCIMALRNIFSRRGTPAVIYSDRGTNFQGAHNTLETAVLNIDQNKLIKEFTSSYTEWKFNPPAAPHMGGA
ncbi:uncharacterized protein LOC129716828 [Wyeomyia smithii]|uniref:uncharacterized protein LOC129716828 n=1 Tax=Wyeomyia smithii TaxID=174621 RepID=UPI002467CD8A|nr:uncharacterized protein LOC129716828 [Wyeomyia smithii]